VNVDKAASAAAREAAVVFMGVAEDLMAAVAEEGDEPWV
jgi:hypothetical protein